MAAGISMKEADVSLLREEINKNCTLSDDDMEEKVLIDVPVPMSYITIPFIESLSVLEPFGNQNPKPLFAQKNLTVNSIRIIGKNKHVVKMRVEDEAKNTAEIIYFGATDDFKQFVRNKAPELSENELFSGQNLQNRNLQMNVVYYPDINEYMGKKTPQIVVTHYR